MKASIRNGWCFFHVWRNLFFLCPFLRKEVSTVANRIRGITVEIGGDTTKLQTALKGVNGQIIYQEDGVKRVCNNLNQYAKKANETGKLYEEDIAEIKMMNNEQTELLKKALEVVIHLYEEDSKKRK